MKRFVYILILFILAVSAVWFYVSNNSTSNTHSSDASSQDSANPNSADEAQGSNPSTKTREVINEIVKDAENGELPHLPFKVGETNLNKVKQKWGNPDNISHTNVGLYASFKSKNYTIGYFKHSPIFDIRSYENELQDLTRKDIEQVMGKPNQVLSYDKNEVHQKILIYPLDNGNDLKWIMNQTTAEKETAAVDHISLYNPDIAENSLSAQLNNMSLAEKIGQMVLIGMNGLTAGSEVETMIKEEHIGGIILYGENISTPNQTLKLTNQLKAINQNVNPSIPLFISVDEEGGIVERMPNPILPMPSSYNIGKKNDADLSYLAGQTLGEESSALGFNMNYAPVLDVIKNLSTSAIGKRSFGTDPKMVSRLGSATMKGLDSKNVIPVLKHFPGYGSVSVDAHKDLPTLEYDKEQLENQDWLPYKNAIDQGADVIMVTHMLVPSLGTKFPSSMSPVIITDMLRKDLNFNGLVMTDDLTMGAIEKHYSIKTAAVQSVKAGADVVMVAFHENQQKGAISALKQAVKEGKLSEERIDDSVYRILKIKQKYKLSNQQLNNPDISSLNRKIKKIKQSIK
ncbi:glycoside hydrolase family 3 N-terminal domain-containing protein [Halobacillus rhizosphaerae]|uniref:glycoside hydrolase family 3 N-terminal domain-containing protein n=1 Tax=Halobacillus rhizosphaerae TaxID=3064889 RepID=UPI00398BB409